MGLDQTMYAYSGRNRKEVDFNFKDRDSEYEIHYWRKHPNLEQYMSDLYFDKGGEGIESGFGGGMCFNCCRVELKVSDLIDLADCIKKDKLPEGGGFFHGSNSDEDYKEETLEAIDTAIGAIGDNKRIYYTSWW